MINNYRQCKKWDIRLTKIRCILKEMAEEVPIARGEVEILCDKVSKLQENLIMAAKGFGKLSNKEKKQKVIDLAVINPTLSMSAIARHFGFSEAFVAKVCREHGGEINGKQRGNIT